MLATNVDGEVMPRGFAAIRRHPTPDRVDVINLGNPHVVGVCGEASGVACPDADFLGDELMISAQQRPNRFLAIDGEYDQSAVRLSDAGNRSGDGMRSTVKHHRGHLFWPTGV